MAFMFSTSIHVTHISGDTWFLAVVGPKKALTYKANTM